MSSFLPFLGALTASILVWVIRWRPLFDPARRPPFDSLAKAKAKAKAKATAIGYFFNSILPSPREPGL